MSHPPLCLRLYHPIQCLPLLNFTATSHPFLFLQMSGCMLRLAMWPTEKLWTYVDKIMTGLLISCETFASYIPILCSRYKLPTFSTYWIWLYWNSNIEQILLLLSSCYEASKKCCCLFIIWLWFNLSLCSCTSLELSGTIPIAIHFICHNLPDILLL